MPFLFLGAVFLVLAVWMYAVNTAPVGGLPIWILFAGIGVIALTGGFVGAFLDGDADETVVPARPPIRAMSRPASGEVIRSPPDYEVREEAPPPIRRSWAAAGPPAPRAAPPVTRPRDTVRVRAPVSPVYRSAPSRAPPPRSAAAPTAPRPRIVDESYLEDDLVEPTRYARGSASVDDILQSLDDLSSYLTAPHPPNAVTPDPVPSAPGAAVSSSRSCAGCEDPIPGGTSAASCRGCGLPICPNCTAIAVQQGHEGVCPTCAVLDAVAAGARAS